MTNQESPPSIPIRDVACLQRHSRWTDSEPQSLDFKPRILNDEGRWVVAPDGTLEGIYRQAEEWGSGINKLWTTLHDVLDRHEDTIVKRWTEKKAKKRLGAILRAWPKERMLETSRSEYWSERRYSKEASDDNYGPKYRYDYLMPYINQESLSKPHILPLLLRSRGRYLPSKFAGADAALQRLGCSVGVIQAQFVPGFTMYLSGFTKDSIHLYGCMISWRRPDAYNHFVFSHQFEPGAGLLVLEVQHLLLTFLVNCCREILHDLSPDSWISDYPVVPPQLRDTANRAAFDSLAVLAEEAPYRVPTTLDFKPIESLLVARASAAKDKMWQLREDPLYFAHKLIEVRDHRGELIKDTSGKTTLDRSPLTRKHQFWKDIVAELVGWAYCDQQMYTELQRQAQEICRLQAKYIDAISPANLFPDEFMAALVKFRFYLHHAAVINLLRIQIAIVSSPNLRQRELYVRDHKAVQLPGIDPILRGLVFQDRKLRSGSEARLLQILETLSFQEEGLRRVGLALAVEEVERLLRTDKNARDLISPFIEEFIGDLSILSQCIEQLDRFHPWSRKFMEKTHATNDHFHPWDDKRERHDKSKRYASHHRMYYREPGTTPDDEQECEGELSKQWRKDSRPWEDVFRLLTDFANPNNDHLVNLLKPFTKKIRYPIDKSPTKVNIEAVRLVESQLDALWACLDDMLLKGENTAVDAEALRSFLKPRALQRTPEWVAPVPSPTVKSPKVQSRMTLEDCISPVQVPQQLQQSSQFQLDDGILRKPPKMKKRRSQPNFKPETNPEEQSPPEVPRPLIQVDKVSLKVFRTMFFTMNVSGTPGEISWTEFVRGMTAAGFRARQLYGSVWQFQRRESEAKQSILFHEPHKGKIPYIMARHIGRRLSRAYGWDSGTFVLKAKGVDAMV